MNKKKIFTFLMSATMITCTMSMPSYAATFSDVDGHWAIGSINRWSDAGIVKGFEGKFRPNSKMTRAEMAVVLANLLGLEKKAEANTFPDVKSDDWYADAILKCAAAGIMKGNGVGANPNVPMTREEAATLLARAFYIESLDEKSNFADENDVSEWAKGYVAALEKYGIINGVGDNIFAPDSDINRASVVKILDNAIGVYANKDGATIEASKDKLTIIAADNVTVTGDVGNVLIVPTSKDMKVIFNDANVTGIIFLNAADTEVVMSGKTTVDNLIVSEEASSSIIDVSKDSAVEKIEVNADNAKVEGKGDVKNVEVNGDNATIKTYNTKVETSENASGTVAGDKKVEAGETVITKEPQSSGGGQVHSHKYNTSWSIDENYHWYGSACGHGNIKDKGTHAFDSNGKCKCGYDLVFDNACVSTLDLDIVGDISALGCDATIWVKDGSELTINGDAKVHATLCDTEGCGYSTAVWAQDNSKITITGGTYTNEVLEGDDHVDLIYAKNGSTIEITGGEFKCATPKWTLNLKDKSETMVESQIIVKGGRYYQFNPAEVCTEQEQPLNFVAEGYTVVKVGDWYEVVPEATEYTINLTEDISADGNDAVIWAMKNSVVTLNGETKVHATLGAENFSTAVWALDGAKITITGGTYTNEVLEGDDHVDLIYAKNGSTIEITGGEFKCATPKWTLNLKDETESQIIVKGGRYYQFNPSIVNTEREQPLNFVAEGYTVVKVGDWYEVVPEATEYTINLAEDISADGNDAAIWAMKNSVVTLSGDAKVHATLGAENFSTAVWALDGAKITITGGTYTNEVLEGDDHVDLIYAKNGATIEITGGEFKCATPKWTLNLKDETESQIIVKGGRYYQFNPSIVNTEREQPLNFVAEGYTVVEDGDWYEVVAENNI